MLIYLKIVAQAIEEVASAGYLKRPLRRSVSVIPLAKSPLPPYRKPSGPGRIALLADGPNLTYI